MRAKPFYLTLYVSTDGQGDSSIPPNFVMGGIKKYKLSDLHSMLSLVHLLTMYLLLNDATKDKF